MFKNLKDKVVAQANKTNQAILSSILQTDLTSSIRTSSVSSRDENHENNRSRLNSASSDISQITNYISPTPQYTPPSDIEFDHNGDESDYETNSKMKKLLDIYKNKFSQLKNAYDEVEHERNRIKDVLQKYQDTSIKQREKLREKIKFEQQEKEQIELKYQKEIKLYDDKIEELNQQLTKKNDSEQEENRNLREKITKLEASLNRYKEGVKTHQEKQADLIIERDKLLQQLNEIQLTAKDRQSVDSVQSDHDKEQLQEQLESIGTYVQQLETDLELAKKEQLINEEIKHERDEFKQNLFIQNEKHTKEFDSLKIEYENLTNELNQMQQARDNIQSLFDQITQEKHHDQSKTDLIKLTEKFNNQQIEFDNKLKEEMNRLKIQYENEQINISNQYEQELKEKLSLITEIERLKSQHEEFEITIKRLQNEINEIINKSQQSLEEKDKIITQILTEKSQLENEIKILHLQLQTTESTLNEKTNDYTQKLEQTIKDFEIEQNSYKNKIETLKTEILSLMNINEENTHRIDEFINEKYNFEQEFIEKDRQIKERDEKIQDIELTLKQTQENGGKLRKALQNLKDSITNDEQTNAKETEIRLQKLTETYEQKLKDQEIEYDIKLKAIAKEMNTQIDEKEKKYNEQLNEFIQKTNKTEFDVINNTEKRITDAEERALIFEKEMLKMEEKLKENQLEHYQIVHDLEIQIQNLTKDIIETTENTSQTVAEDLNENQYPHSIEVDYLKKIVHAYMTGTDQITMAKVICAVLRYTEDETSLIVENEKLRHARWLNSSR